MQLSAIASSSTYELSLEKYQAYRLGKEAEKAGFKQKR